MITKDRLSDMRAMALVLKSEGVESDKEVGIMMSQLLRETSILSKSLDDAERQLGRTAGQLEEAVRDKMALKNEHRDLQRQIEQLKAELDSTIKARDFRRQQVEDLTEELREATMQAQALNGNGARVDQNVLVGHNAEIRVRKPWLDIARAITSSERQRDYGRPLLNFVRIALRWSNWLERFISPVDVAVMMMDTKIARQQNTPKDDNMIDVIGYAACIDDMDRELRERGCSEGIKVFEDMDVIGLQIMYRGLRRDGS